MFGEFARGCRQCQLGIKSVLFITGICPLNCFYCPVSRDRFGKDVMFINDRPVSKFPDDIIDELDRAGSNGLAITGGDPIMVVDRVVELVRLLKDTYGRDFHIHMYTHVLNINEDAIKKLAGSGIDEVRIHAVNPAQLSGKLGLLKMLKDAGIELGLEVPALPRFENDIVKVAELLINNGLISFVNINELDVSPANINNLISMGYKPGPDGSVIGSIDAGIKIATEIRRRWPWISVNVCTSRYKDLAQIGARLFRINMRVSGGDEVVLDDGTVESRGEGGVVIKLRIGNREYDVESG
ncbi:Radical SAM domain protein [Vulcanisaeta moutnovskia 768-28]|uniref:Radical SAM domain protein n=1 Tax=Vulcanisaeta moutnovskia (strain 768-28) TaxID=985053 RepID=F0QXK9_VULM7|nr:Radical SAM domain protein [Vulcanisaeta moutnovskia 768-28]